MSCADPIVLELAIAKFVYKLFNKRAENIYSNHEKEYGFTDTCVTHYCLHITPIWI